MGNETAIVYNVYAIANQKSQEVAAHFEVLGRTQARRVEDAPPYKDLKGGILEQIAKFVKAFKGVSIDKLNGYQEICDLKKVRNCIVHCYGEISMSPGDKEHLLKLSSSKRGIHAIEGVPIEIETAFLDSSIDSLRAFFRQLFESVGWTINKKWLLSHQ